MAEPVNESQRPALVFDLAKAIAGARADFPEETKNITFVDISAPDAVERLKEWMAGTSPVFREKYFSNLNGRDFDEEKWLKTCLSVGGFSVKDSASGATIVAVRTAPTTELDNPFGDVGKLLAYIFAHELGHGIVDGGHTQEMLAMEFASKELDEALSSTNRAENAADAFAMLYGMRKGWFTPDDVAKLAARNAGNAGMFMEFAHFTSIGLDHIAFNRDGADVMSLTPQEIRAIAAAHAKEFALDKAAIHHTRGKVSRALTQAYDSAMQTKYAEIEGGGEFESEPDDVEDEFTKAEEMEGRLKALAKIYTKGLPPPGGNPIPYFIAQHTLSATLRTGKIPCGPETVELSGDYWDGVRKLMAERAAADTTTALLDALEQNKREITAMRILRGAGQPALSIPAAASP